MTAQETLLKYVSDMYTLEDHIIQPLKSQAKDQDMTPYPEVMVLFERILNRLKEIATFVRALSYEIIPVAVKELSRSNEVYALTIACLRRT